MNHSDHSWQDCPELNPPKPAELYPTKTRLALLRAIQNSQVQVDTTAENFVVVLFPDAPTSWQDRQVVTARVIEVERAGWVELRPWDGWQLTAAGRAVLDGA